MIFNHLLALICLLLVILCLLPLLKNHFTNNRIITKVCKHHQLYAFLLVVMALVHGIIAGNNPAMISGKIAWVVLILIIVLAYLIKQNKPKWKKLHLIFSIIFVILVVVHIIYAILS